MTIPSLATGSYAAAQRLAAVEKPTGTTPKDEFASLVKDSLKTIEKNAATADRQMGQALQGGTDLISVVTAVAESETAVQSLVSVRDKVIAAYDDVMRMTI